MSYISIQDVSACQDKLIERIQTLERLVSKLDRLLRELSAGDFRKKARAKSRKRRKSVWGEY